MAEIIMSITGNPEALAAMEDIHDRDGEIEVHTVIEAARPKGSPLHDYFTWNVREAAQKRWEDEARALIRVFKAEYVMEDRVVQYRRFISVESGDGRAYKRSDEVVTTDSFREAYYGRLVKQAQQFADRIRRFEEFADVVRAIEAVTQGQGS